MDRLTTNLDSFVKAVNTKFDTLEGQVIASERSLARKIDGNNEREIKAAQARHKTPFAALQFSLSVITVVGAVLAYFIVDTRESVIVNTVDDYKHRLEVSGTNARQDESMRWFEKIQEEFRSDSIVNSKVQSKGEAADLAHDKELSDIKNWRSFARGNMEPSPGSR